MGTENLSTLSMDVDVPPIESKQRRQLLLSLAATLLLPICPALLLANEQAIKANQLISFDVFWDLSKRITGHTQLNHHMAEQLYDIFKREPWGMDHLQRVAKKLITTKHHHEISSLDKGEHWFLGHFLTSWMTGIYYHSSGNIMVSYEHALMHDAFTDIRPTPGLSDRNFGFWSEAPSQQGT